MSRVAPPSLSSAPARSTVPGWVRIGLLALGLPNAVTGLWAIVAPRNWFNHFPGWDPRLVAAEPPFNAHLAADAGAGLFASGVVLLAAAWLADRRSVTLALVAFSAFAAPHAVYHSLNPAPGLSTAEDVVNAAVLVFVVVAAIAMWAGSWRRNAAATTDGSANDSGAARASQPEHM